LVIVRGNSSGEGFHYAGEALQAFIESHGFFKGADALGRPLVTWVDCRQLPIRRIM
jgi:hypothetical protein